jgi:hypothetical protein
MTEAVGRAFPPKERYEVAMMRKQKLKVTTLVGRHHLAEAFSVEK